MIIESFIVGLEIMGSLVAWTIGAMIPLAVVYIVWSIAERYVRGRK